MLRSSHVLTRELLAFREKYPRVQYEIYTNTSDYIKEKLDRGLLDFGLLLEPVDVSRYDYIRLREKERWGLFIPEGHSLAAREQITREDLKKTLLITPSRPVCPERDFQLAGGRFPEPGHPCRIQSDHGYDGHDEHRGSLLSGYRGSYGVLCGERAGLPPPVSGAVYSLCPCLEEIPALKRSSGQISGRVQTETGIN